MSIADRNRLAARVLADYTPYDYPIVFAGDMNAVAGVGTDAQADMEAAAASAALTALDRVQTSADKTATDASNSTASTLLPVTLDRTVGSRANDTSIWTMVRSTPAWGFGPTGLLEETAIDTIRWEFNPATLAPFGVAFAGARTNSVRNPRAEGAVVGSPGAYPTYWGLNANGMTSQVVGFGTIAGRNYIDIRLTETGSSGSQTQIYFDATVAASSGQVWSAAPEIAIVGGTTTGVSGVFSRIDVAGGTGTAFGSAASLSATLARAPVAIATCGSGTTSVRPSIQVNRIAAANIDITLRFALPQMELGPFLSAPILPPAASPAAQTRAQGTISIPVRDLGSKYNYRQGVLIVDWNSQPGAFTSAADTDFFGIVSLGDLGANEVMGLLINHAHTAAVFRRTVGGVVQSSATLTITPPAAGETVKFAMTWDIDAGFMQVAARGAAGTKLTGHTLIPAITHLMPGRFSTTRPLFGRINKIEFLPAALFDSSLAAKT